MFRVLLMAAVAVGLASCATPYAQQGFTGGFEVLELRPDVFRVQFAGNGYTTRETVQVYWLYRCAQLALEKGFNGFEILSDMQFVMRRPADERDRPRLSSSVASLRTSIPVSPDEAAAAAAWRPDGDLASRSIEPIRMARGGGAPIFIYSGGGGSSIPKPAIEGDVHFLSTPVASAPPKVFNAKELRDHLEPLVKAEKCGVGNVCPHVHEYLLPRGKLR
jgi:hypothetical protein